MQKYSKNINGKLALGYGSKYQLLRMLGWHREDFNSQINQAIGQQGDIRWIDFNYNGVCDDELLNLEFIPEFNNKWKEIWSCGTKGLSWDAIGIKEDGTYILIEAKAHLSEFRHNDSDGSKSKESKDSHIKLISELIKKYSIKSDAMKWDNTYYQIANRLVITDFLIENGYKAKLVYVLFENGYELNCSKNDSVTREEWNEIYDSTLSEMGVKESNLEQLIFKCIVNCKRKK